MFLTHRVEEKFILSLERWKEKGGQKGLLLLTVSFFFFFWCSTTCWNSQEDVVSRNLENTQGKQVCGEWKLGKKEEGS